jgi:hypothetical protein
MVMRGSGDELMRWFPWAEANGDVPAALNEGSPIIEPPCKLCRHWNPQVRFQNGPEGQVPSGVILCHADSMHRDFSCFKLRTNTSA